MARILRTAGGSLLLVMLALAGAATVSANTNHKYGFCQGIAGNPRTINFTRVFDLGPAGDSKSMSGFRRYLHTKYDGYVTQEVGCRTFATAAEAQAAKQLELDAAVPYPWPVVELDWTPAAEAPPPTAAAKPAPAPVAAAVKPPASVAVPAMPAAAAPAAKAGVFVICRVEFNTSGRRFYNPPVEVQSGGYPEWQAAYTKYLEQNYQFKGSGLGCGKYPTQAAAQADYDSWLARARAQPTINGVASPVIITKWTH